MVTIPINPSLFAGLQKHGLIFPSKRKIRLPVQVAQLPLLHALLVLRKWSLNPSVESIRSVKYLMKRTSIYRFTESLTLFYYYALYNTTLPI